MRFHQYFLFTTITLLLLFNPGMSDIHQIFAYYPELFRPQLPPPIQLLPLKPIPYVETNATAPEVSAEGVYILDLPTATPIYEKNFHTRLYPASTTKVITALVAYDIYKPSDIITIQQPVSEGQVMGLVQGEQISVEKLLYGALIHSGNDAALALAQNYGTDKFVELMNQKAQSLGMRDTHFVNPSGLDDLNQYTTPFDLSIAARTLLNNPYLSKIVSIKEITISDENFEIFHKLTNVNKLLGEVQGIGGLKTGYTEVAGENLVSFYKKNGHSLVIVILKSKNRFEDTKSIIRWTNQNVTYKTV